MVKKLLASFLLLFLLSFLAAPKVFAEEKTGLAKLAEIYCQKRSGNQVNLETWYGGKCDPQNPESPETIGFGDIILIDLYTKLAGEGDVGEEIDWLEILKNLFGSSDAGYKNQAQLLADIEKVNRLTGNGGALTGLSGIVGKILSTPPASTKDYLDYVAGNIRRVNPVQPAYAQTGFGFQSIQAVLPIWRAFRNITYLIFVLVFVIYGFMIMFRVKINPQTTANIQAVLPKVAIVLLTVTFSYAIVGLAIDLSYVATGVIWSILTQAKIIESYSGVFGSDFLAIGDGFAQMVAGRTIGLAGPFIAMLAHFVTGGLSGRILAAFMPGLLATIIATIGVGLIIGLILLIAVFFTLFRIAWMLLKAYVNLIIATIFAPIMLLPGIMPGNNAFSGWLRGVIAELSIFVVTTLGLLFAFYFIGPVSIGVVGGPVQLKLFQVGNLDTSGGGLLIPPPLAGGQLGETEGRFALLGIGLFFIIPGLADKIRKALQAPVLDFGTEIGKGIEKGFTTFMSEGFKPVREKALGAAEAAMYAPVGFAAGATGRPAPPRPKAGWIEKRVLSRLQGESTAEKIAKAIEKSGQK